MTEPKQMANGYGDTLRATECSTGFYNTEENLGIWNVELVMNVNGEDRVVHYDSLKAENDELIASGKLGDTEIECETELRLLKNGRAATIQHSLTNNEKDTVTHIKNIRSRQTDDGRNGVLVPSRRPYELRYCHTDNVRTEQYPHCQTESPYVDSLPVKQQWCGKGQDQPFPAIYLTDVDYDKGIVVGALDEVKTMQSYKMRRSARPDASIFDRFEICHEFTMADGHTLDLGETLDLEGVYIELTEDTHPQDAYLNYIDFLAEIHDFRGPRTELLDSALYCTWNYGRMAAQVEDELLETAAFIGENMPNIEFFLVDAGYTYREVDRTGLGTNDSLDVMYNGPDEMLDPDKIADMRAFSRKIRDLGLRPGLWWTPTAMLDSNLYRDHPDWFLRNEQGGPYRIANRKGFLDLTVPEARDFMDRTLEIILGEWDMDATKMDFWSQNFEDRQGRLQRPNVTAVETREILFDLVRKHLPDDGVFMTCVATGMGKPFIAKHADTYRNTIDIGPGTWHHQVGACYWALPVLSIPGRRTFLHNNDSVGVNLDCPDNENFFRLTWCFITMGMQEIGGALEELPPKYVQAMRKYTDRCERGFRCLCPDESAFKGEPLPDCLYVNYPENSRTREEGVRQSVALFNWSDTPKMVSVKRSQLDQDGPVEAENFWTEERERFDEEFIVKRLGGRSALLYDILD